MAEKCIEGLTPEQLKDKFAIPQVPKYPSTQVPKYPSTQVPKYVTGVVLPKGMRLEGGVANLLEGGYDMTGIKALGKELSIQGRVVTLPYETDRAEQIGQLIVVVVDGTDTPDRWNNVFAYDFNGNIVWQIQELSQVFSKSNTVPYVGFHAVSDTEVLVTNFNGVTYRVSIQTGHILGQGEPTK